MGWATPKQISGAWNDSRREAEGLGDWDKYKVEKAEGRQEIGRPDGLWVTLALRCLSSSDRWLAFLFLGEGLGAVAQALDKLTAKLLDFFAVGATVGDDRHLVKAHDFYGGVAHFQGLKGALKASTGLDRAAHFLEIGSEIALFGDGEGIAELDLYNPAIDLMDDGNGLQRPVGMIAEVFDHAQGQAGV
jgi:hypothetical protein